MPYSAALPLSSATEEDRLLDSFSDRINAMLTPGLVHEMNNLLTGIYFNLETMRDLFDSSHPANEALKETNQSVERIKELLGRAAQIHLNTAEREQNYHDLEALVSSQLDLLRLLFPKTARISIVGPDRPLHVHVAEFPFRVALLAVACVARDIVSRAKAEIIISMHSPESLASLSQPSIAPNNLAVGISFPVSKASSGTIQEIDAALPTSAPRHITLSGALELMCRIGGSLRVLSETEADRTQVLLVLPEVELNL